MYRIRVVCLEADALYASKGRGFGEAVGIRKAPLWRGFIKG